MKYFCRHIVKLLILHLKPRYTNPDSVKLTNAHIVLETINMHCLFQLSRTYNACSHDEINTRGVFHWVYIDIVDDIWNRYNHANNYTLIFLQLVKLKVFRPPCNRQLSVNIVHFLKITAYGTFSWNFVDAGMDTWHMSEKCRFHYWWTSPSSIHVARQQAVPSVSVNYM